MSGRPSMPSDRRGAGAGCAATLAGQVLEDLTTLPRGGARRSASRWRGRASARPSRLWLPVGRGPHHVVGAGVAAAAVAVRGRPRPAPSPSALDTPGSAGGPQDRAWPPGLAWRAVGACPHRTAWRRVLHHGPLRLQARTASASRPAQAPRLQAPHRPPGAGVVRLALMRLRRSLPAVAGLAWAEARAPARARWAAAACPRAAGAA